MRTRRSFLKDTGGIGAAALIFPSLLRAGKIGMTAHSAKSKGVGIQLYSVRKEMMVDAAGTLKRLGQIGYQEIESAQSEKGNYYGLAPKEIKKMLNDQGMRLRSGHTHIDKNWQKSIDDAAEARQDYIICSVLPSRGQTVENYEESADLFSKAGEECRKSGIRFGYHNHDSEFETVNGRVLYDILLDRTDPQLVHMEMDLGWVIAAGKDPLAYFDKYPGRFPLWHLKDMDKTERRSTEFGKGKVDLLKLLKNAKKSGMKHYFVEQEEYTVNAWDSMEYDFKWLNDNA